MKKILAVLLPSLLTVVLIIVDLLYPYKDLIIVGIYLFFPVIYVIQGIITADSMKTTITGILLSSLIIMITTSIWYNMGSLLIPVIIYSLLGLITSFLTSKIKTYIKKVYFEN